MSNACHIYFNKKQNLPRGIKKPHKRLRFSVKTVVGDEGGVSLFIMQIKTKPPVIAFHFDKMNAQIVKNSWFYQNFLMFLSIHFSAHRDSMSASVAECLLMTVISATKKTVHVVVELNPEFDAISSIGIVGLVVMSFSA